MSPTEFKKPAASAAPVQPKAPEAKIFTMPERYRHGAHEAMRVPQKQAAATTPAVQVRAPMAPATVLPKQSSPIKRPSARKRLLVGGAVFLVLLVVGGLVAVNFLKGQPAPVAQERTAAQTRSVQQPSVPKPAAEEEPKPGEPTATVEPEPFATTVAPGIDTDSDGLTDAEEVNVYKTNPRLPDTDADGFLDGNEVFHRYNPGGTAPVTLLESGLVARQVGESGGVSYEFYAPTAWDVSQEADGWTMDARTGAGVRITFEARDASKAFGSWVEERLKIQGEVGLTKNGLPSMVASDKLKMFIDLGSTVMMMVYDPGTRARVDYLQTMQMMANTVSVVK